MHEDQKFKVLPPWLHNESEASLGYKRPFLKTIIMIDWLILGYFLFCALFVYFSFYYCYEHGLLVNWSKGTKANWCEAKSSSAVRGQKSTYPTSQGWSGSPSYRASHCCTQMLCTCTWKGLHTKGLHGDLRGRSKGGFQWSVLSHHVEDARLTIR